MVRCDEVFFIIIKISIIFRCDEVFLIETLAESSVKVETFKKKSIVANHPLEGQRAQKPASRPCGGLCIHKQSLLPIERATERLILQNFESKYYEYKIIKKPVINKWIRILIGYGFLRLTKSVAGDQRRCCALRVCATSESSTKHECTS